MQHAPRRRQQQASRARLTLQAVFVGVITLTLCSVSFLAYVGLPDPESPALTDPSAAANPTGKRFAYMLYATTELTMCNALIMAQNIRRVGTPSSIPIVILASAALDTQPREWASSVAATHATVVFVEPWTSSYMRSASTIWRDSLTKLRIFEERGYDRVVYLDSDMWLHRNLDHLFDLSTSPDSAEQEVRHGPLDAKLVRYNLPRVHTKASVASRDPSMLWAPRAYYISPQPFFASTLMVFTPSNARFRELEQAVASAFRRDYFDMDVLNDMWANVTFLPAHYVVLNSDLASPESELFGFANASDRIAHTYAHHFSSLPNGNYGKPWDVQRPSKWRTKRRASPLFYHLFDMYLDARDRECPWLHPREEAPKPGYMWQLLFGSDSSQ